MHRLSRIKNPPFSRISEHSRRRGAHRNLQAAVTHAIAGISNGTKGAYIMTMTQTTIVYDTHAAVRRLTKTGMPEPQAEAVVREQSLLLEHNLATKADIEALRQETKADIEALRQETKADIELVRADIEALRQETKAGIEALRQETKAGIEALRQETKADIALVKAGIEALRQETKADIEALRQETKADIEALRQETKAGIAAVQANVEKLSLKTTAEIESLRQETKADIATAKNGIIMWVVGLNMAMVGLVIAAVKLL